MNTQDLESALRQVGDTLRTLPSATPSIMVGVKTVKCSAPGMIRFWRIVLPVASAAACFLVVFVLGMGAVHAQFSPTFLNGMGGTHLTNVIMLALLPVLFFLVFRFLRWLLKGFTERRRYAWVVSVIILLAVSPTAWKWICLPLPVPVTASVQGTSPNGDLTISGVHFCPPEDGVGILEIEVRNTSPHAAKFVADAYLDAGRIGPFRPGVGESCPSIEVEPDWNGTIRIGVPWAHTLGYGSMLYLKFHQEPNGVAPWPGGYGEVFLATQLVLIPK